MKCINCGQEMSGVTCSDDPNTGYAFNLYHCDRGCSSIMKHSVWNDKSKIWILPDNTIKKQVDINDHYES